MAVHGAIGAWLLLLYSCSFGVYCMLPCALKLLYLCLESIILKEIPVFLLPFNGCFAVEGVLSSIQIFFFHLFRETNFGGKSANY